MPVHVALLQSTIVITNRNAYDLMFVGAGSHNYTMLDPATARDKQDKQKSSIAC